MGKTILIGIDGMDLVITEQMIGAGQLPNFERLADQRSYKEFRATQKLLGDIDWFRAKWLKICFTAT